jgi:hypothetical protein
MKYLPDGRITFDNITELFYELFMEMGFSIQSTNNNYLYDQDTCDLVRFDNKYIKASLDGSPIYTGANDIAFDPAHNYRLISHLFGYYITKCENSDDGDILQGFTAWFDESIPDGTKYDFEKKRVVIRTVGRGDIISEYYYQIYLAFIDVIFKINGKVVDLSMFDCLPEITKK